MMMLLKSAREKAWRFGARNVQRVMRAASDVAGLVRRIGKSRRLAGRFERLKAIERSGKPVTLFMSPEAGLEPFHASQVILAKTLDEAGHASIVLSCDGLLPMCSVKFATRTEPTSWDDGSNPVCVACRASRIRTAHEYELLEVSLESLFDAEDRNFVDSVIDRNFHTPWLVEYDDIEFGIIALAEVLRDRRKHEIEELDVSDIRLLVALLRSSLAVYVCLRKLSVRFNLNQVAYFGEYAYWQAPQILAARKGFGLLALSHGYHGDVDRRLLSIRPCHAMAHYFEQIDDWQKYQDDPISPSVIEEIANGALYRLSNQGGASTYSPIWSDDSRRIFEELGLSRERHTIVAYPSSYDEYVCIAGQFKALGLTYPDRPQPFADQEAWLLELVQWVSSRPDLQLVLRMHPRMGIGHRHSTVSSDYRKLRNTFSTIPSNVVIVWPESVISSYSLAEFAEVALISWSSMGLELARFGVPVVAAFQRVGPVPLSDFIEFEVEADRYFAAVETALSEKATIEKMAGAFRWTHYLHWASLIDVSDVVPAANFPTVPPYSRPREQSFILEALVKSGDVTQMNMARLDLSRPARAAERAAIVKAIQKFTDFFDGGRSELRGQSDPVHCEIGMDAHAPSRLVKRLLDLLADEEVATEKIVPTAKKTARTDSQVGCSADI